MEKINIEEIKENKDSKIELKIPEINNMGTLMVDLPEKLFSQLPEEVDIDGINFIKKDEFHATVFGFPKKSIIENAISENPNIKEEINKIISEIKWDVVLGDENILIGDRLSIPKSEMFFSDEQKELMDNGDMDGFVKSIENDGFEIAENGNFEKDRKSIIKEIKLPGVAEFYKRMKDELNIDLGEIPPTHVTLYVTEDNKWGIGINTDKELSEKKIKTVSI